MDARDSGRRKPASVAQGRGSLARPRWKRVIDAENNSIGMILGRDFVKEYFPEPTKKRYSDLVESIRIAYGERIDKLVREL